MTVIVGLVCDQHVLLAADGIASDGSGMIWQNPDKLRRVSIADGDSLVIGTAGRTAAASVIDHHLKVDGLPDETNDRDRDGWAHAIAESITELVKNAGMTDSDGGMDGTVLVAWRRWLWEVTDALALPIERFATIGAGGAVALGALDVLVDEPGFDPGHAVRRAVEAACRWNTTCRPPTHVESTLP